MTVIIFFALILLEFSAFVLALVVEIRYRIRLSTVLYDVFRSCQGHYGLLVLLLSILVPFALPVCLRIRCKKNRGMAPILTSDLK